ncbi:DUF5110 domain-containing protein [Salinimicrobium tongyeongense]|uniref:DUF5110 domain-containing protein n=1 Tax=Salinimicrobium tongyeongense TaxID=2809707 RepID=A0ABY6NPI8_9FLAO|nr:glycoside hydrolase family 31 protein [Salinimicrobium tongyeongense]UZH54496.1 DUF5110 domain-containing protein [Salinimicrobium tongyeongense]
MNFRIAVLLFLCFPITSIPQERVYELKKDRLSINLEDGVLEIIPFSPNAVRVQMEMGGIKEKEELILVNQQPFSDFQFSHEEDQLQISTDSMLVTYNRKERTLNFSDVNGEIFLSEKPGSRIMKPNSVMGEPAFLVEQTFHSPEDEFLFGLGQFQDGHYNLRNISRKLIQVNSQIAIPFLYSSKGYGILWHQYGLTEYNPADNEISLVREENADSGGEKDLVEITTTSGTQKISREEALYSGKFSVDEDGDYIFMLDLGDMDSRHLVVIDDSAIIDHSNLWLPPAASKSVHLKAGEHSVQVVSKSSNTPKLSWKKADNTTTFRSPHAKSLDYVVFNGNSADEVIGSYRELSGNTPMLPLWAYGFWQCRERYTSASDLVETVKEFRRRELPMDVIVQDWQYWGDRGWGVPQFDETNYPNPSGFIQEIHDLNAHLTISIWSNPDKNSEIGKEYVEKGLFIPETKWLDYFNPETGRRYWQTLNENLFTHGIDGWWMDATEPENDALTGEITHRGPGEFYRLTYPLFVSESVYEGQRRANPEKRVTILTRSAFAGQHRYGTINWSGDIGGTWEEYQRQIVAGLNYSLTGMPFWTTDIGGFFRPGASQYTDENYRELLTRWFQWGTFNTIFRVHGYQSETEPWKFGEEVESNMRKMLDLRYRLLPYIYSGSWHISKNGYTMMRPMVMDFQDDAEAVNQSMQYMLGDSFLVAPVTEFGAVERPVYLPKSSDWFDFWSNKKFTGGQTISRTTPIDIIPLFIKAGSIIPIGPEVQYSEEKDWKELEIRIYPGAEATFTLYEDENDNYNYEEGAYSEINFLWNENEKMLTIEEREGDFEGMFQKRSFNISLLKDGEWINKQIEYNGNKVEVKI